MSYGHEKDWDSKARLALEIEDHGPEWWLKIGDGYVEGPFSTYAEAQPRLVLLEQDLAKETE